MVEKVESPWRSPYCYHRLGQGAYRGQTPAPFCSPPLPRIQKGRGVPHGRFFPRHLRHAKSLSLCRFGRKRHPSPKKSVLHPNRAIAPPRLCQNKSWLSVKSFPYATTFCSSISQKCKIPYKNLPPPNRRREVLLSGNEFMWYI